MLSNREKAGLPAGKKISLPINRDNVIPVSYTHLDVAIEIKLGIYTTAVTDR